jgi:hypothetical protein
MTPTTTTVWTDPELADLVADDPELVAIADAILATGPTTAVRTRRSVPIRLGLLAAAVAGLAALILVSPWTGGGPGLADRALAAIGDGPVLHVVTRLPDAVSYVDIGTGATHQVFDRQETWYDRGRGLVHTITRRPGGTMFDDVLETPQGSWTPAGQVIDCTWIAAHPRQATKLRVSCNASGKNGTKPHVVPRPVPTVDPALGAFLDGYQHALADGRATATGAGIVEGRRVIWLTFRFGHETESVALDASTYRPLLVRDASGTWHYRILSIDTVSRAAANFVRPTPTDRRKEATSGGTVARTQVAVDRDAARRTLPGALWLGSSFRSLPLAGIERSTLRTSFADRHAAPRLGIGLQFAYGPSASVGIPERTTHPFVQLWESSRPQFAFWWPALQGYVPSPGTIVTRGAFGRSGSPGFLVRRGVYVTLWASSPKLALAAARALTPIAR